MRRLHPAVLRFALAAGLLLLVLGGCSKDKAPSQADGPMKLTWVGNAEKTGDIIRIMEEKFNVDIMPWVKDDSFAARIAAGEIPDLFNISLTTEYRKYIQDQIIAELPWTTVQQYAPKLYQAYIDNGDDTVISRTEIGGKNYGLSVWDGETGGFRQLIVYRGDWIEKVGGKVPDTLAEFEDLMYKFARNDPDGNGKNDTYGLSSWMMQAVYGAYGYIPEYWAVKDGQMVYGAVQPEMKEALTLLAKWYKDGVLHPEYITGESTGGNGQVSNHFVNGQIGVSSRDFLYWKPSQREGEREGANITELKVVNPAAVNTLVYGKRPPAGPTGKRGMTARSSFHGGAIVLGVQTADQPDKTAKILEILQYAIADNDGFMLTRFGVEGTHWNMGDNGFPLSTGNLSEWGQISRIGGGTFFTLGSWLKIMVSRINAEYVWGASMPELRQDAIMNALVLGLPSAVDYGTELGKLESEAYTDIITGKKPVSSFDTFVQQWKAAGGDILTKEANQK